MGFLQNFFQSVFEQSPAFQQMPNSFSNAHDLEMQSHMDVDTYGDFQLTDLSLIHI